MSDFKLSDFKKVNIRDRSNSSLGSDFSFSPISLKRKKVEIEPSLELKDEKSDVVEPLEAQDVQQTLNENTPSSPPPVAPVPPSPIPPPVPKKTPQSGGNDGKTLSRELIKISTLDMSFMPVLAGNFKMGSSDYAQERPMHRVVISNDFWMSQTLVTQLQYKKVVGVNPSLCRGDNNPVESVKWGDAVLFCQRLTIQERKIGYLPNGYEYRLPTESEWEYAARGGSFSKSFMYAGASTATTVAWCKNNCKNGTRPVAMKPANELGLYDMSGNVWEWCFDLYGKYGYEVLTNPVGAKSSQFRVIRGGCWDEDAKYCRSTSRGGDSANSCSADCGFRVVLAPQII